MKITTKTENKKKNNDKITEIKNETKVEGSATCNTNCQKEKTQIRNQKTNTTKNDKLKSTMQHE